MRTSTGDSGMVSISSSSAPFFILLVAVVLPPSWASNLAGLLRLIGVDPKKSVTVLNFLSRGG